MATSIPRIRFEVIVRPEKLNVRPDHLSWIDIGEEPTGVEDDLPDAHLFWIEAVPTELEEIAQFLESGQAPKGMSMKKKQILAMKDVLYSLVNGFLYKIGLDDMKEIISCMKHTMDWWGDIFK